MFVMSSWCSVAEPRPVCLLKVQYMFASGLFVCGKPSVCPISCIAAPSMSGACSEPMICHGSELSKCMSPASFVAAGEYAVAFVVGGLFGSSGPLM